MSAPEKYTNPYAPDWEWAHVNLLSPHPKDYFSPRGPGPKPTADVGSDMAAAGAAASGAVTFPKPGQDAELLRVRRQNANHERARKRADKARSAIADAQHATRGVLRALDDFESVDRLGMLPQGDERLTAAQERLEAALDAVHDALDDVIDTAHTERVRRPARTGAGSSSGDGG